jgi:WD40 repeat protein
MQSTPGRIEWGGYDSDESSSGDDGNNDADDEKDLWNSLEQFGDGKVPTAKHLMSLIGQNSLPDKNRDLLTKQARVLEFEHGRGITSACFSHDGRSIATGSKNNFVRVFDVAVGTEILTTVKHRGHVVALCFSLDGNRIATATEHDCVRVFDVATGKKILKISNCNYGSGVTSVCFSPDGMSLATGSDGSFVRIFEVLFGKAILKINLHVCSVKSVCFSPDGKSIATGSVDRFARVFDVTSGKEILKTTAHGGSVKSVCFSPDGKTIATGSVDMFARVFDVSSGTEILRTAAHGGSVTSVCFSPDGKSIATGSADNLALSIATGCKHSFARVFELSSGNEIMKTNKQRGDTLALRFLPDGSKIATATELNFARIFEIASIEHRSSSPQRHLVPPVYNAGRWIQGSDWEEMLVHQHTSPMQPAHYSSDNVQAMVKDAIQSMGIKLKENTLARDHIIQLLLQVDFLNVELEEYDTHAAEGQTAMRHSNHMINVIPENHHPPQVLTRAFVSVVSCP